jgi:hypothetical protein
MRLGLGERAIDSWKKLMDEARKTQVNWYTLHDHHFHKYFSLIVRYHSHLTDMEPKAQKRSVN